MVWYDGLDKRHAVWHAIFEPVSTPALGHAAFFWSLNEKGRELCSVLPPSLPDCLLKLSPSSVFLFCGMLWCPTRPRTFHKGFRRDLGFACPPSSFFLLFCLLGGEDDNRIRWHCSPYRFFGFWRLPGEPLDPLFLSLVDFSELVPLLQMFNSFSFWYRESI